MKPHVLTGTKEEIAQKLASLEGEVREAIVFVEEPPDTATPSAGANGHDLFAEMEPYMVSAGDVDYSRAGIYSRKPGE
jgi:hypothetical protein